MIRIEAASRFYRTRSTVVRGLDKMELTLSLPTLTALCGPSGCGKSTLLNVLAGIDGLDEGSYRYRGELIDINDRYQIERFRRQEAGMIFQDQQLLEHLKVKDNILLEGKYEGADT